MGSKKVKKYVCDFETTTDLNDCRVWAWCLVDIETAETVAIGTEIDTLFEFLESKNSVVFYHNLKFDGEFILSYLHKKRYKSLDPKIDKKTGKTDFTKQPPRDKSFNTLITDGGLFYSITVYFKVLNKRYNKVVFYDSLKKLPFKVSTISKAFNLDDEKLSIDYTEHRPKGHKLTEEERQYIVNDCRIVAQALKVQFDKGLTRMTTASDALGHFKEITPQFDKWFPEFPLVTDDDIRRAYKGGFTYLNPKYKNKRVKEGITFDVNSLYPSVMYDRLLPYGYPIAFEGEYKEDERYPLYVVRIRCCFKLKKNHIPTIQLKNNRAFIETEYLTSSNGEIVELTLTNVDLQLMLDHYDTSDYLEYIGGYKFKGATGMFTEYIDYWGHIKETSTGAMRQLAKLQLNSLYGKFATNPRSHRKVSYMGDDGIIRYEVTDEELKPPVYTAMGAFITAYAREKTIRSAQKVYNRFIYADTDSLHLEGYEIPEGLDIHPTRLGAWKHEGSFCDSVFIRPKTYMETMIQYESDTLTNYCKRLNKGFEVWRGDNDNIKYLNTVVTCAGMPENVKKGVTYDNFVPGSVFTGKLIPKRCPGGVVLIDRPFTIK